MHRFFVNPAQIGTQTITLLDDQARQIADVLRLRVGERIGVLDNLGWLYEVGLTAVHRRQVTGEIVGKTAVDTEPTTHITLYQSILKRDKFEWVLQKGSEIGISRFVPVITERSAVIASYALCGFANFASIGIQLGGIGGMAPERMADLASLGFRAMLGGVLAACMTGCVAGLFL